MHLPREIPVLITGSAGRLGRAVGAALTAAGWRVRGFDRVPTPGLADFTVGDLTDFAALQRAASGVSAVIHFAAIPDDDDFLMQMLPNNLLGVHHVFEAARLGGAPRLILASTGQVNWWQQLEGPWPVRVEDPITPRHWYAAAKVFMEAAGRGYARSHGLTVLAVRLGWCPRVGQEPEIAASGHAQNLYLSPGDAGRFFLRTVEASLEPGFELVFASSRPLNKAIFDLEPAKRLLDWEPREQWPQGLATPP